MSSYAVKEFIYSALSDDETLNSLIGEGRIHYGMVPAGANLPAVIYFQSDAKDISATGALIYGESSRWVVKVIADSNCEGDLNMLLSSLSDAVMAALHKQQYTASMGSVASCIRISNLSLPPQQSDGIIQYSEVSIFRIISSG